MQLDEKDIAILNEIGCEEPWHIIAAILGHTFDPPSELANRLLALRDRGYVVITAETPSTPAPTCAALLADAQANDWYDEVDWPDTAVWNLRVTEEGFAHLQRQSASGWISRLT
jgi:hypothetical protein